MTKTPKTPRDPNQIAKFNVGAAISEKTKPEEAAKTVRARKGGPGLGGC